ncbi:MAG TPA: GNAT family N-acetyltransferase [Jatrophihabitantaceae bacterium]
MSVGIVVPSERDASLTVRSAGPADHPAIRHVVAAAYRQYRRELAAETYSRYVADLLDLDRHAYHGHLFVAEVRGRVIGSGAFYPDSSVHGLGWPIGWAGGRALAVHPAARGAGVARALLTTCEHIARKDGAPVFAFHAGSFMTGAIALYEKFGYRRAPEFDVDLNAHYGIVDAPPATALAYLRYLSTAAARRGHSRCTHHGDHAPQRPTLPSSPAVRSLRPTLRH